MVLNTTKTICYKCKQCKEFISAKISAFDIATGVEVKCTCGNNDMVIKREGHYYVCAFSCSSCSRTQMRQIDAKDFWQGNPVLLTCNDCGSVVCSIGDSDNSNQLCDAEEKHESDSVFNHVIAVIQDFSERGKLQCECGNHKVNVKLGMRGIDLICKRCGARKFIKASEERDLDKILKTKKIRLVKNESKIIQFFE